MSIGSLKFQFHNAKEYIIKMDSSHEWFHYMIEIKLNLEKIIKQLSVGLREFPEEVTKIICQIDLWWMPKVNNIQTTKSILLIGL